MGAGFQNLEVAYFIVKNLDSGKECECDFYDEAKVLAKELREESKSRFTIFAVLND